MHVSTSMSCQIWLFKKAAPQKMNHLCDRWQNYENSFKVNDGSLKALIQSLPMDCLKGDSFLDFFVKKKVIGCDNIVLQTKNN